MAQVQLVDLAGREQEKSSVDNKDRTLIRNGVLVSNVRGDAILSPWKNGKRSLWPWLGRLL